MGSEVLEVDKTKNVALEEFGGRNPILRVSENSKACEENWK